VSSHMMAFGASGATPKHRMAQVSSGLGLLRDVVVDQHFEQRTRLGRLLAVVAQSPNLLGIGLDEDTAAVVYPDQSFEVVGRGAVTIIDGANIQTDAFYTKAHRPMMISGVVLHSLPSGYRFDLRSRSLQPPVADLSPRAQRVPHIERQRMRSLAKKIAAEGADSFVVDRHRAPQRGREASE
jgi:cyanophycinase